MATLKNKNKDGAAHRQRKRRTHEVFILVGIHRIEALTRPLDDHIETLVETVESHLRHREAA